MVSESQSTYKLRGQKGCAGVGLLELCHASVYNIALVSAAPSNGCNARAARQPVKPDTTTQRDANVYFLFRFPSFFL